MNNRIIKKFISILIIACMFSFTACKQAEVLNREEQPSAKPTERVQNAEFLSGKDIKTIKQQIDSRVETVKNSLDYEYDQDHYYDGDVLAYRRFLQISETEGNLTSYDLYYDTYGKLIYADVVHYRATMYSMYFYNDELLHVNVEVGPFTNGDMEEVKAVVKKDSTYRFVLEDISVCLERAYMSEAEHSIEDFTEISDDEINLDKIDVGVYKHDLVRTAADAKAIATVIFKSILGDSFEEYDEPSVGYNPKSTVWIVNISRKDVQLLGEDYSCAIRQKDGKILKIWQGE